MRLCYSIVMFMALLMLVSGLSLMAGCGKKGPLYHPIEAQQTDARKTTETDKTKKSPAPTTRP